MPRIIGGEEWWPHKGKVVESEAGANLGGVDIVYTAIDTGEVLEVRDPVTEDVLSVSADFRGQTPEVILLPAIQAFVAVEGGRTYQSDTSEFLTMKDQVDAAKVAAEGAREDVAELLAGAGGFETTTGATAKVEAGLELAQDYTNDQVANRLVDASGAGRSFHFIGTTDAFPTAPDGDVLIVG